jgi:hypothetical protein
MMINVKIWIPLNEEGDVDHQTTPFLVHSSELLMMYPVMLLYH